MNKEYIQNITNIINKNKDKIINMYTKDKIPISKIGKIIGLKRHTVWRFLTKHNIKIIPYHANKYPIDENYFEKIDSHEKAYWLGWLASDGYINEKDYTIALSLIKKDVQILINFKKCLKSGIKIETIENKHYHQKMDRFKNIKTQIQGRLRFKNKKMVSDLVKLGIGQNKSLTIGWPNINDKYFYSFMRGYIEGDGCICIYKGKQDKLKRFCLVILATKEFSIGFLKRVKEFLNIDFNTSPNGRCPKIFHVQTCNKNNVVKLLDKCYENDDGWLRLDRKYNKYLEMKEYLKQHPVNEKMISKKHYKHHF